MKTFFFFFAGNVTITDEGVGALKDLTNLKELALVRGMISGITLKYLVNLRKLDLHDCPNIQNARLFELLEMPNLKEIIFSYDLYSIELSAGLLKIFENILKSRITEFMLLMRSKECSIRITSIKSENDSKILWEIDDERKSIKKEFKPVYSDCDLSIFIEKLMEISQRE